MKKLFTLLSLCYGLNVTAQINVGSKIPLRRELSHVGKLSEDDIRSLKNSTVLFTLQSNDYEHVAIFEKAISEVWKLSRFQIIKVDEIGNYINKPGYAFFTFGSRMVSSNSPGMSVFYMQFFYELWTPVLTNGQVVDKNIYSSICLSGEPTATTSIDSLQGKRFEDKIPEYEYTRAKFDNWGAGFLKGYLATINRSFVENTTRFLYTTDEDTDAMHSLGNDTLFVPDCISLRISLLKGLHVDDDINQSTLEDVYSHKLKFIPTSSLDSMIANSSHPMYYLVYTRHGNDKFVNVYHTAKGIVFTRYDKSSNNFKMKDLKAIDRELD